MTVLDKIKEITEFLKNCGIDDAHKESEMIIIFCLDMDKTVLYRDNPVLSSEEIKKIDEIAGRRIKREPLQYILGYVEFYELKIKVGEGVLIPRPETELLVEEVVKAAESREQRAESAGWKMLDLCTGSGCLALALAKHFPDAKVYGTDISATAIRYAKENAELNGISNAVFMKGSLYEPLKQLISEMPLKFDVIVSNPPYIKSNDIPGLQPEISKWEPKNALDGGEDGLRYYREILAEAPKYLAMDGFVFLEAGEGQAEDVSGIARSNHFRRVSVIKDYAGIERIVIVTA
ncbi:MAG: peptide chain release factor N(5)-glutamine methyltransferase [Nitrospirae bacterium]|nr:peptide chain release factor N(5)-glutamine methyltransferase [Nitrospirota bacterium]